MWTGIIALRQTATTYTVTKSRPPTPRCTQSTAIAIWWPKAEDYAGQVAIRCNLANDPYYVFLGPAANPAGNSCNALTCSVVPATNQLLCSTVYSVAVYDTFYLRTATPVPSLETVLFIGESANPNFVFNHPEWYNMTTITIVFV